MNKSFIRSQVVNLSNSTRSHSLAALAKRFVAAGALLSLMAFNLQAQGQLSFNVSAGPDNDTGVFGSPGPETFWTSGDISLPAGTTIGPTPLEIDLALSQSLTLDDSGHYAWSLNYLNPIPVGSDLGSLYMVLLFNGTPITPQVGFDAGLNNFPFPVAQFGTGYTDMPPDLTFNGVQIFVSNANPSVLTDVQIELDAVPEPSTLGLLAVGASLLLARRRNPSC
jgi:hypothetical protein